MSDASPPAERNAATMTEAAPILSLRELTVEIPTRHGLLYPVDEVSWDIAAGEILGVVGESGAGKSMTGNAVIGLLDSPAHISGGQVLLQGERIDDLPLAAMRRIRGKRIGMVFQDPLTSLNPLVTIGRQLTETIRRHLDVSAREARDRAVRGLDEVGIPAARDRLDAYPHEFSGGMRQRVVIALALCAEPTLLIADEPTTALDVSVQAQITSLLKRLCRERGMAAMLVTHDMGVIAETADRVAVMYAGRVAEIGPVAEIIGQPRHPYTEGLMASTPAASAGQARLRQIPGAMPRLGRIPPGCAFNPRCPRAVERCLRNPRPVVGAADERAACWLPIEAGESAA